MSFGLIKIFIEFYFINYQKDLHLIFNFDGDTHWFKKIYYKNL
jgi:hypothetical protein